MMAAVLVSFDLCVSHHAGRRDVGQLSSVPDIVKELVLPLSSFQKEERNKGC
jgi:hypothetical protein